MKKNDICAFTVRVPSEIKIQLDILATRENRSTNNLITVIFQEYIKNQNEKKKGSK